MTFNDPKDEKDPAREEAGCSKEPSIGKPRDMVGVPGRAARHPCMVGRAGGHTRH